MTKFEFFLPDVSPVQFLLFVGKELGFYRPDELPKPIKKTGVIYREFAYSNSMTIDHALSYRDDWTVGESSKEPEALRIVLFYGVKDRTDFHQTKHVNYCYFMAQNAGTGLIVSGYLDNPKETTWDEDGELISLPEGFPEKEMADLFAKIVSRWPEAILAEGEPKKPRVQPGPKPKSRAEKIKAYERGQRRAPGVSIEEYLKELYGEYSDGQPKVAKSTYYGWKNLKSVEKPGHDSE